MLCHYTTSRFCAPLAMGLRALSSKVTAMTLEQAMTSSHLILNEINSPAAVQVNPSVQLISTENKRNPRLTL